MSALPRTGWQHCIYVPTIVCQHKAQGVHTRPRPIKGVRATWDIYDIYEKEANSKNRKARQADIPRYKRSRLISQDNTSHFRLIQTLSAYRRPTPPPQKMKIKNATEFLGYRTLVVQWVKVKKVTKIADLN